jgi:hypothetical protein
MTNKIAHFALKNLTTEGLEQVKKIYAEINNDEVQELLGFNNWRLMIDILEHTIHAEKNKLARHIGTVKHELHTAKLAQLKK